MPNYGENVFNPHSDFIGLIIEWINPLLKLLVITVKLVSQEGEEWLETRESEDMMGIPDQKESEEKLDQRAPVASLAEKEKEVHLEWKALKEPQDLVDMRDQKGSRWIELIFYL